MGRRIRPVKIILLILSAWALFKVLKRSNLCAFLCIFAVQLVSVGDLIAGSLKLTVLQL